MDPASCILFVFFLMCSGYFAACETAYTGVSKIVDVACGDNGSFALLDNNRKHIFVYNEEGYLLYAFSGPDVTAGGLRTPSSIDMRF